MREDVLKKEFNISVESVLNKVDELYFKNDINWHRTEIWRKFLDNKQEMELLTFSLTKRAFKSPDHI